MTASINLSQVGPQTLARVVGGTLLATILVGMATALTVADGIDINLSADVAATAQNMLEAETQLRAKSYIALLMFGLEAAIGIGLFLLLRPTGQLLAGWSFVVSIAAAILTLSGAVFNMNAAELAGDIAYAQMASESQRLLLTGLQATSDYTSFHLALILSSVSKAGFFFLFLKSGLIPRLIAGWGLFASLFVSTAIILRDFILIVGHSTVTVSFMASNLVALVATALYLAIKGVRSA
ncbi:hypothetical protein GCM10009096_29370 [Parasphingorhabdus litoris]|uniref:DUF4386 domain-containing protein n=1 Tax=Parasphingorhabdus litoris TaxID=394733 RepID=A0ABN1AWD2_9SPHN|nr:DUF4386 domain-containing protein [Parasphingorhabdus litoris]